MDRPQRKRAGGNKGNTDAPRKALTLKSNSPTIRLDVQLENAWTVAFAIENGKNRVGEYFKSLADAHKTKESQRLAAALDMFGEHGPPKNPERFKFLGDGICEVKNHQERLYGFLDGHLLVLTSGRTKKRQKAYPEDLETARRIRGRYEAEKRPK